MAYFLGIDGGGTKTTCLLGDERQILGRGKSGASNLNRVSQEAAGLALRQCVTEACTAAGVAPSQISRTVVGSAGAGRPESAEEVRRSVAAIVAGEVTVVGDMATALHAAFGNGPGIVVISGTGSIAFARNEQGETARAGGWGWAISDEGSGPWIGRRSVAAIFAARDAGMSTLLQENIRRAWDLKDIEELVIRANSVPQPAFGKLLPEVTAAAEEGDAMASRILDQAGQMLAELARIVGARMFADGQPLQIAMSGGVFANAARVREAFAKALLPAPVLAEVVDPVIGALNMARQG